jgi:hypothetical protein
MAVRSGRQPPIEFDDISADPMAGKLRLGQSPAGPPQALSLRSIRRQRSDRVGERFGIVDGNKVRINALPRDFPAAGHVRRDDGTPASSSFKQALGKTLTP